MDIIKKTTFFTMIFCSLLTFACNAMNDGDHKKMHDQAPMLLSSSAAQEFMKNMRAFKLDPIAFHKDLCVKLAKRGCTPKSFNEDALYEATESYEYAKGLPATPEMTLERNLNFLWSALNYLTIADNDILKITKARQALNQIQCTEPTSWIYQEKDDGLQRAQKLQKKIEESTFKTK